ncbi:MAG: hypothetical protein OEY96_08850 [Gammaproteobacteria bacterium]|nr:hypothetical protein [Gammaproteobacteria bacterium]
MSEVETAMLYGITVLLVMPVTFKIFEIEGNYLAVIGIAIITTTAKYFISSSEGEVVSILAMLFAVHIFAEYKSAKDILYCVMITRLSMVPTILIYKLQYTS